MMYLKKPYIILGLGIGVGVCTCAIHLLYRKNKEVLETKRNRVTRTVKIPRSSVGHVLGRHGATIKSIREKTRARIVFDDQGSDFTIASVSGSPDEVEEAVNEINQIITSRHGTVTKEIDVTENISNSIFKNINIIRQICDRTRAKITFDFLPSKNKSSSLTKVVIKGMKEEVDAAMYLIDELVAEVEVTSNKSVHVAGRALPNNLSVHPLSIKNKNLPTEKLIPSHLDGYIDVYVSAVDTPNKFWVQISGFKSTQLDKLATEMTEFYDDEKNKSKYQPNEFNVGDIVAAYFLGDSSWYRAQILKITDEDEFQNYSVFYLDFGDCAVLNKSSICVLKQDYLSIPFQAIECSLADVTPVDNQWTEEAIDEFEKLVYLGSWKVIMAKPLREGTDDNDTQLVTLLDTNTKEDINISAKLVSKGHAKFIA